MASIVFSGQYSDHGGRDWYMEIYSLDSLTNTEQELDLMSPGVQLTYEMDSSNLAKSMIGSSASITVQMTDDQLAKMETLLTHAEGRVGMFLYNDSSPNMGNLEWAGHLLIEQTSIYMHSEINTTSLTFSDGLSHLKYIDYKQDSGEMFFDRQSLVRHLFRCLHKLPVMNMLKERYTGSYIFLSETGLPAPVDPGATYEEWSFDQSRLDKIFAHSQTFGKPKNQTERHRNIFQEAEFISAYDVVEDICKTLGACITFSNGRWVVWNRTSVFNFSDSQSDLNSHSYNILFVNGSFFFSDGRPFIGGGTALTSDVYQDVTSNAYTLDGATEGRTVPLAKVIMTHEDVEKDTIIAEGLSRKRFRWMDTTPGQFSQHSLFDGYPGTGIGMQAANDQYSYGSNKNYGYPYVFDFTLYDFTNEVIEPDVQNNISVDNPLFRVGFPDRTNNDLSISGGQNMIFAFGGSINLREHVDNSSTDFITKTHLPDSVFVIKARIEVIDTDGTSYRLSRTVDVLDGVNESGPSTVHISLDSLTVSTTETHNHKIYNDLEWLQDNHADYDDAWFEMMAPHGATANNQGDFENVIAQIPGQYNNVNPLLSSGQNSYGGIFVDWNEEEDRLEARKATVKDQYRDIRFKENIKFELPGTSTDRFNTAKLSWRFCYLKSDGTTIFESGTSNSSSDAQFFPTGTQFGFTKNRYFYPERLVLNYADIRLGDGSNDMDLITSSEGGPGLEVYNAGASRLGSRDGLLNPQVTGHLIAPYNRVTGGGTLYLDANGNDPSLDGIGHVNLKWIPFKDAATNGPGVGRYNSIHSLIVSEYMACFGEQTRTFQGSIKNRSGSQADILRPYQVFRTPEYDDTVAHDIMLTRVSWSMLEGTQFEGIEINRTRYAQSNITQAEDKPRGPGSGRNPGKPGITEQMYGFTSGFSSGEIVDIGGIAGTNTTKLSNITFDANNEITAIAIKSGSIAFDADKIEDGTTNKVFTSTEQNKLSGIEQSATANQSNDFLKNRTNHTGTQTASTISNFASAVNAVTEVAASKEVTDTITVTSGVITGISIDDSVLDVDSIEVTPNKTFVSSVEQALILPTAQVANTASTNASNALAKTNLIQSDSGGVTGFTIADNVTVLSTDQVTEDVGRTFKTATEQSKLDKIGFNTGNTTVYNLDTEAAKVTASKNVTDRIATSGSGSSTKITTLTTTNGDFDVDDGRAKMGFLTSDATGITQITVSASVDIDGADVGNFFASSSGGTSTRTGVTNTRVLLITSDGKMGEVTDGSAGQFLQTDGNGRYSFAAGGSTTLTQVYSQNFFDDISTLKHYLPFKDINEQTTIYQEEAAMLMPFDGRIKSISLKTSSLTGNGSLIVGVSTLPTGSNIFSSQSWTEQETETIAVGSTDDNHTFHFVFDNAKHFDAGDSCVVSLIAATDVTGNGYWYVTTVVEYDTSNNLGSSSTEHETNP